MTANNPGFGRRHQAVAYHAANRQQKIERSGECPLEHWRRSYAVRPAAWSKALHITSASGAR
jgi:bisphosphoglycerate-dependent phosphoglycerate mutase